MAPVWYSNLDILFNKHSEHLLTLSTDCSGCFTAMSHPLNLSYPNWGEGSACPAHWEPSNTWLEIRTTLWGSPRAQSWEVISGVTSDSRFHALSDCQRSKLLSWEAPGDQPARVAIGKSHLNIHHDLQMWTHLCPTKPVYERHPANAFGVHEGICNFPRHGGMLKYRRSEPEGPLQIV